MCVQLKSQLIKLMKTLSTALCSMFLLHYCTIWGGGIGGPAVVRYEDEKVYELVT